MSVISKFKNKQKIIEKALNLSPNKIKQEITNHFLSNKPKNDDELHMFIQVALGLKIPRNAVCSEHAGVFDFIADAFFERYSKQIILANRTGGKTIGVAALNVCEAFFKPGCGIVSIGGSKQQAEKCYTYTVEFINSNPALAKHIPPHGSLMSRTKLNNGSYFKVLASSERSVHHDHVPKVRLDEVELIEPSIYEGAISIPLTKNGIKANILLTSTRFKPFGLMQKLLDTSRERGYKIYIFCYKDISERCPDSRSGKVDTTYYINKSKREIITPEEYFSLSDKLEYKRFEMLNKCQECTLAPSCTGDLKRATGWYLIDDLIDKYTEEEHVWASQWECLEPYRGNVAFPEFDSTKSERELTYNPNWPIYCTMDFGWSAPFFATWFQVDHHGWIYFIDEYSVSRTLAKDYGKVLKERGATLENDRFFKYIEVEYHGDPAGKSGNEVSGLSPIEELKRLYSIYVKTRKIKPNDRFNFLRKKMSGVKGKTELYIDKTKCPLLFEAFSAARIKETKDDQEKSEELKRDKNIHGIDAASYGIANVFQIKKAYAY